MKKIIFLLILILVLVKCFGQKKDNQEELEAKEKLVSLVAFGDNLIHDSIYTSSKTEDSYNFVPIFQDVKNYLQNYDLRFINQETILGGSELGLSTYPAFNTPQEMGDALVDAGFNLISLANNHTLDRGEKAIINSVNYWDKQAVVYSGSVLSENESQVKIFKKNGISFAFVAYTYGTNGIAHPDGKYYLANLYDDEKAERDILAIREQVDVVIVSMHWGDEYQEKPNQKQINQAENLAKAGADIIIGHHPHVIQPVAMIENEDRKTFVVYSLGNFLSDQVGIDRLIGMGVNLDIRKQKDGKIHLENFGAKLLYRYKNYNDKSFRLLLFQDLNSSLLKDYEVYFEEKKELIQYYYQDIKVS
ncbi:MAG: CapA family protein [Bacilli bacterium]|nr:CapA family protein [Bacilli bacterium]